MPVDTQSPSPVGMQGASLVKHLRRLYDRSKNVRRSKLPTWVRNYQLVNNRFGATTVAEPWIPNPRSSEIYPVASTFVAWLADQNPEVSYSAAADPSAKETFDILSGIASDLTTVYAATWHALNFTYQLKLGFWDVFTYGIGIYKTSWDQSLDGGLGNISLARIHPWAIYIDPKANSFDDADYIIEARRMSIEEVERRWPGHNIVLNARAGTGEIDEPPRLDSIGGPTTPPSNAQAPYGGNMMGITSSQTQARGKLTPTGEVVVYEYWLKENEEWWDEETEQKHVAPQWRVVIVSQGEILMDEFAKNLWSHKSHPYTRFVLDDIGEFYGIALCDHLAGPQVYINRLLSAAQLNTELTGNPVLVEPQDQLSARVNWTNKPGQRIPAKGSGNQGPAWLNPPSMSSMVMELIQMWRASIANISGLSDAMKGNHPTSRTSQGTMASAQESTFVRIRSALGNLETAMQEIATKHADIIIDNYTKERYVAIVGNTGEQTSLKLKANHFNTEKAGMPPFKYAVQVDAGAQLPTSLAGKIAREMQLFQMRVTDDEALLAALRYPKFREVLARKYEKQANGQIAGGGSKSQRAGNTSAQYGGAGKPTAGSGGGS